MILNTIVTDNIEEYINISFLFVKFYVEKVFFFLNLLSYRQLAEMY